MSIITLTTDLGTKDHYVATVKGEIYKQFKDINIVDISNEISKFDIHQAAFVFKNCYRNFPEGTVHIIGVNEELTTQNHHLAVEINKQFIIGSDNGIFSLIFDEIYPDKIFKLNIPFDSDFMTFSIKDIFVKAACHFVRGGTIEMIGEQISDFQNKSASLKPVVSANSIRGSVIHIDSYGNAITNINKDLFSKIRKERNFEILYGKESEKIIKIVNKYKEVIEGERLSMFDSNNFLEISMNQGRADKLLGLEMYDIIRIEFK